MSNRCITILQGIWANPLWGYGAFLIFLVVANKMSTSASWSNAALGAAWIFLVVSVARTAPLPEQPLVARLLWTTLFAAGSGLVLYYFLWSETSSVKAVPRARITIVEKRLIIPATEGEPVRISYQLMNSGDGDGVFACKDRTYYFSVNPDQTLFLYQPAPSIEITIPALSRDARWNAEMRFDIELTPEKMEALKIGRARLFFYAHCEYRDATGVYPIPFTQMYDAYFPGNLIAPPKEIVFEGPQPPEPFRLAVINMGEDGKMKSNVVSLIATPASAEVPPVANAPFTVRVEKVANCSNDVPTGWFATESHRAPIYGWMLVQFTNRLTKPMLVDSYLVERQTDKKAPWERVSLKFGLRMGTPFNGSDPGEVRTIKCTSFDELITNKTLAAGELIKGWIALRQPHKFGRLRLTIDTSDGWYTEDVLNRLGKGTLMQPDTFTLIPHEKPIDISHLEVMSDDL